MIEREKLMSTEKPWFRLPRRSQGLLFAIFMSMFMAFCMSGVLTAVNTGIGGNFFIRWAHAFSVAWPVALPLIHIFVPLTRKILSRIEFYS
jgi:hypothetical protein